MSVINDLLAPWSWTSIRELSSRPAQTDWRRLSPGGECWDGWHDPSPYIPLPTPCFLRVSRVRCEKPSQRWQASLKANPSQRKIIFQQVEFPASDSSSHICDARTLLKSYEPLKVAVLTCILKRGSDLISHYLVKKRLYATAAPH